jgi:hypothetical protein
LELLEFKEKHGHTRVPLKYGENPPLGNWVKNQRILHRKGKLSEDHISRLNEVGFVWEAKVETSWEDRLLQLFEFTEEHGHTRVPCKHDRQLGMWVINQRMLRKRGSLTEDRIAKLDEIGFIWEAGKRRVQASST